MSVLKEQIYAFMSVTTLMGRTLVLAEMVTELTQMDIAAQVI